LLLAKNHMVILAVRRLSETFQAARERFNALHHGNKKARPVDEASTVIELTDNGSYTLVAISGEFDMSSEPHFASSTNALLRKGYSDYVVDLEGVTYLDGRALGSLMTFFKAVNAQGGTVRIVTSNAFYRRLFSITGIDRVIALYASRAQAETALRHHQRTTAKE
jgi:anti-sigma B factor antagonist